MPKTPIGSTFDLSRTFPKMRRTTQTVGNKSYADTMLRSMKKRLQPPRMVGIGIHSKKGKVGR